MSAKEQFVNQFRVQPHKGSDIKKIIAVVSGKGGVGKSMVTSLLAVGLQRKGCSVGIMDSDVTGASIPHYFGVKDPLYGSEEAISPQVSETGIKMISSGLMISDPTEPIVWRSPMITQLIKQFYTDVAWGSVDCMLVDLPPGTGDVPLTIFQSLPLTGIVIVTTPQDLVSEVVEKAVNMAKMMEIPVLGIVNNMSYIVCPDCGRKISMFGDGSLLAENHKDKLIVDLPVDPLIAKLADTGMIENAEKTELDPLIEKLISL